MFTKRITSLLLALLLTVSVSGCYSDDDIAAIRSEAHNEGYSAGYEEGHSEGYDEGYDKGYDDGYDDGHDDGYEAGEASGQRNGAGQLVRIGEATVKPSFQTAETASSDGGDSPMPKPTSTPTPTPEATPITITVYITRTGEKYHRNGCQYLRQSQISISLSSAKAQGYTPCSKCNPPR
jgi:hypothetical protein